MAKCDICGKGVHFGNNVSILIEDLTESGIPTLKVLNVK